MDMFRAVKYLGYFFFSHHRRGHGIHSPFVFDLISDTFRNKTDSDVVLKIEKIRRKLISDQETIYVNDIGSGSVRMKNRIRKVSDIAKYSSVPKKYGVFLYNMSKKFGNPLIVELGTSLGISTLYLASACPDACVYTIEGCSETAKKASENFAEAGLTNIKLLSGSFDDKIPEIRFLKTVPGLVYIDGDHRRESTVRYFEQFADIAGNDTVVILDDIYSGREMAEAWNEIKNNKKVSFTVDIFRMGIVFFRQGMSTLHYIIRY